MGRVTYFEYPTQLNTKRYSGKVYDNQGVAGNFSLEQTLFDPHSATICEQDPDKHSEKADRVDPCILFLEGAKNELRGLDT